MKARKIFITALLAALAALTLTTAGIAARDACQRIVVTNDDVSRQAEDTPPLKNWVLYTGAASSHHTPGVGNFIVGPGAPPSGIGSLETITTAGTDKVFLNNYDYANQPLSGIQQLSYSTYRFGDSSAAAVAAGQLPSINIAICANGIVNNACSGFTTLVYEPTYNDASRAALNNTWETWDAYGGVWWSTRAITGQCAGAVGGCFQTLGYIQANNPNAVIISIGVNQGSGNTGLHAASDALSLTYNGNCVTYDFEPYRVAETKDQCKNGGFANVKRADGSSFKNQGDCIQYVNTGK
jgi:hypothetical protein